MNLGWCLNVSTHGVCSRWKFINVTFDFSAYPLYLRELSVRTQTPNAFPTANLEYDRAFESILLSVLSALEAEMVFIRNLVGGLLAELEDDIDHDKFKRLLHYSRRLASFLSRTKLVSVAT